MCAAEICDVKIPKEFALEFLEKHADSMVYCYVCGEELRKEETCLICIDGCGIKIERTHSSEDPSNTDESRKKTKPTSPSYTKGEIDAGYIIILGDSESNLRTVFLYYMQ